MSAQQQSVASFIQAPTGEKVTIAALQAVTTQQSALTAALTTITHTAPSTPDYSIQDLTTTTPYGFASHDEGLTVLKVIANLQARVNQLEAALQATGQLG